MSDEFNVSDKHNEFVKATVASVAPELLDQGNFEQQMVALESLVAGLFAATVKLAGKDRNANEYLSALMHGVRGRLPVLLVR